ncbi:phospholipase D-like domain-containing protein [Roseiarcaceae bacterium H3SJ34-1]|uniref:phospholipase D-like domain-containing protein n=1 Tax=Terripilifer ovatus TaxID=3032367 RepID=UPI003AB972C8|nr:phospholipase D-like domain-containing protein [Roseiarcaceae bacterium H3SJ34-1]
MPLDADTAPRAREMADSFFQPGQNCQALAKVDKGALLIDGCDYFEALAKAIKLARRSIWIIAWDFDGHVRLQRDDANGPTIGELLRQRVEEIPELEVRILVWSVAVVHAPSSPAELLIGDFWQHHPRIQLRLDTTHPIYASHHQKIVSIDGQLAFVGGMDVTVDRWDTRRHLAHDPRRTCPDGSSYSPLHDLQLMLNGDAAALLSRAACLRWNDATGETIAEVAPGEPALWIDDYPAAFQGCDVALSRSMPCWGRRHRARESYHLTIDLLRAAKKSIFIESQYFTAAFVGDVLEELLQADEGPEIVVVASMSVHSRLERWVLGENRDRLIRRLAAHDRFGRFQAYYPVVPSRDGEEPILIHSKMIIVDDRFLRTGSSNLNNRSVELDSELDATLMAAAPSQCRDIRQARHSLLAEHLDTTAEHFAHCEHETSSMIETIERLNTKPRRLRAFPALSDRGPRAPVFGTSLFDPMTPFEPDWLLSMR